MFKVVDKSGTGTVRDCMHLILLRISVFLFLRAQVSFQDFEAAILDES